MKHYSEWVKTGYKRISVMDNGKSLFISDHIFTIDTETTSFFSKDGVEWVYLQPNSDISQYPYKMGLVYLWTLSIDDVVYYGRDLSELFIFYKRIASYYRGRKYIFVHNLGYDFQFLRNVISFDNVFARMPYKPIYAYDADYDVEFRCSYMLTNMSLENSAKEYGNRPKLVGTLNYNRARTPLTPLTAKELEYAEFDNLSLFDVISYFKKMYVTLNNIPLTSTGRVRREVRKILTRKYTYVQQIKKMFPDMPNYIRLTRTLTGGYVHANYLYSSEKSNKIVVKGVVSVDKSSSYPYEMVTEKYPMQQFIEKPVSFINDPYISRYAYYGKVRFTNLKARTAMCYISDSKSYNKVNCHLSNGRVFTCDSLEMFITDVDYSIIIRAYDCQVEWLSLYVSIKNYLPLPFVNYVLDLYQNKTLLKGDDDNAESYRISKTYINALFGMMCTNDIRDEVLFDGDGWSVKQLSDEDISLAIDEKKPFLNFAWGVWVLAYARRDLWELNFLIGNDTVYNDTDSNKMVNFGLHREQVKQLNMKVVENLRKVSNERSIPIEKFMPRDSHGIQRPLGVFEIDGIYKKFSTYGSKNYAYVDKNNAFKYTISGMSKKYYDDEGNECYTMGSFEDYEYGREYPNARRTFWYLNNQTPAIVVGFDGAAYECNYKYGVAMISTTYTIGQSVDYAKFLASRMPMHNRYTDVLSQILSGIDDL